MRKTRIVKITEGTPDTNRDYGRIYVLQEMPSTQAEDWAMRAFMILTAANVDLGNIDPKTGFAGIAIAGLSALGKAKWDDVKPLMDEMMRCVKIQPNPQLPDFLRELMPEDIEEVATRMRLRMELFELHTGFSVGGAVSNSPTIQATTPPEELPSPNTPTSRRRLERASVPGKRR